jgi:hypothetical protein
LLKFHTQFNIQQTALQANELGYTADQWLPVILGNVEVSAKVEHGTLLYLSPDTLGFYKAIGVV